MLEKLLEDLEKRIDDKVESTLTKSWVDFTEGKQGSEKFFPLRSKKIPETVKWPEININHALSDYDKMCIHQYSTCSSYLKDGSGELLCVRANYGTSIIPSLFGTELFIMDEKHNTLPTSRPIEGGIDGLKKIIDEGIPDIYSGYGEKVFEMGRRFKEIAKKYPKIGKYVHVYHPDLQGSMDICELLAGSEIFLMIYDEPELVKELLGLITETYIKFMKEWQKTWEYTGGNSVHWGWMYKGCIMLRNDSAMNMSPEIYEEFIKPFDKKLFDTFGGGAMHFCGRGDHYIECASAIEGVNAVNMSQPEYNNLDKIFNNTVKKGIRLLGYNSGAVPGSLDKLCNLKSFVHCLQEEKRW